MATGKIARIVRDRGFGFIKPDGGTEDVFFHSSSVEQPTFDDQEMCPLCCPVEEESAATPSTQVCVLSARNTRRPPQALLTPGRRVRNERRTSQQFEDEDSVCFTVTRDTRLSQPRSALARWLCPRAIPVVPSQTVASRSFDIFYHIGAREADRGVAAKWGDARRP